MAYTNFIPKVWNAQIERDLERDCVFIEDCNRKYEGQAKKQGDQVTILGVGKPTIKTIARAARNNDIDAAETIEDTSSVLVINQLSYFNYKVGDIDKAQATGGIMEALSEETSEELANEVDSYIASKAVDDNVPKLHSTPVVVTNNNVLSIVDSALLKLFEHDVKKTTPLVITVPPRFYMLFKAAYAELDTNNSGILKNGKVGMYSGVTVKMSNNVHTTSNGTVDNIMLRTKRAIAYAQPMTHSEPYRPERSFSDAVKGYILYDAKVVRPKEIININVKYV